MNGSFDSEEIKIKEEVINFEYNCFVCNLQYEFEKEFRIHLNSHFYEEKSSKIKCNENEIPLQIFECKDSSEEVKNHVHGTHSEKYSCDKCPTYCDTIKAIRKHVISHIPKSVQKDTQLEAKDQRKCVKLLKCEFCAKKCKKTDLRQHLLVHSEKRPFKCNNNLCDKSFKTNGDLQKHKVVHSDLRPYECSRCNFKFKTSKHLRQHQRIHSDQKPFDCSKCERSFRTRGNLKEHQLVHEDNRTYKCTSCPSKFKNNRELLKHRFVHAESKMFKCQYCDHTFQTQRYVIDHQRYSCEFTITKNKRKKS